MIIWWIIETLKMVELKNGHHFVTVIFVVEKDVQVCFVSKFWELVQTDYLCLLVYSLIIYC